MKQPQEKQQLTPLQQADCKTGRMPSGISLNKPSSIGKRRRMEFDDCDSFYHIMSRTAGGEFLFGDEEKEAFRKIMWRISRFSGAEILTYAIMGNHFHLLIRMPAKDKFLERFKGEGGEEKLFEHLKLLYSSAYLTQLRAELDFMKEARMDDLYQQTLEKFYNRFCSLRHFVKELKERFSRWYNKKEGRRGTLWQDRYKSILVESGEALRTMAAYIDLNPLRAGLVKDPKDYRWCGYAEAVAGSKRVRRGICRVLEVPIDNWIRQGAKKYRFILLSDGMEHEKDVVAEDGKVRRVKVRKGFDREQARKQIESGSKLPLHSLLRCRVRYFTDGMVLGSADFVEEAFERKREWFGENRKDGARKLPISNKGLFSLRQLKVQVVE